MDNDKIKGKGDEAMGGVKEKAGEWTGDHDMEHEGHGQKMKGKAEGAMGDMKDKAEDAMGGMKDKGHEMKDKMG